MDLDAQQYIEGRKTFFIATDASLLPETYLEDYLSRGYETYIINDDRHCPLAKKVEAIINTFHDSILFFYIDAEVPDIRWPQYIKELQERYGNRVLIGVLYSKSHNEEEKRRLQKYYLFDVGIQCGCVCLEYQKAKNFMLIDKVMYANQARGRRKNIRAVCDNNSNTVNFNYKKNTYKGVLCDISLSHFSCTIEGTVSVPLYEKIYDILIDVNGLHFRSDGILIMNRSLQGTNLYVFIFAQHDGTKGLNRDTGQRLIEKIYQIVTLHVRSIMQEAFDERMSGLDSKFFRPGVDDDN
ncbi:MAG: hypothetical protein J1D88_03595 [Treponema sp.]|nr:hypothetical protein [Treponema sp.]